MERLDSTDRFRTVEKVSVDAPVYTVVLHRERQELGLSVATYCVIASVHTLSHNPKYPYCTMSKEKLAAFLGLSRATVFRSLGTGLSKGLLEKSERGDLRTTQKWIDKVELKRQRSFRKYN